MSASENIPERETAQLQEFFLRQGASEQQAHTMATQLQKRSVQIAQSRNISRIEAMQELLSHILKAQNDYGGPSPSP